jgi:hypothetical protein
MAAVQPGLWLWALMNKNKKQEVIVLPIKTL